MTIITTDGRMSVDIGHYEIWQALTSTVTVHLRDSKKLHAGISFLKTAACSSTHALETARSMNHIHDALAGLSPDMAVYNANDLSEKFPWGDDISPVITSCANYFTTADGKDLLSEIVAILTYAHYAKVDIEAI